MSLHLDIKNHPDVRDLPIEKRKQIEVQSILLSMFDWKTWLCLPLMAAAFVAGWYFAPAEYSTEQFIWLIGGGILGILIFFIAVFFRMHAHAIRLAQFHKSLGSDTVETPTSRSEASTIAWWRRGIFSYLALAGVAMIVVGLINAKSWLVLPGLILLIIGFALGCKVRFCTRCGVLHVQYGKTFDFCSKCGGLCRGM